MTVALPSNVRGVSTSREPWCALGLAIQVPEREPFCTVPRENKLYCGTSPTATLIRRRWLTDQQRSRLYAEHIMAQDLKSVSSNASFDPETVHLLSDAFEGAWQKGSNIRQSACSTRLCQCDARSDG